ncbi:hypothetical protein M0R45_035269 [Rubus argutus]|uniref:Myb-like domain-containing protein n=1 Tax=Rubus argutus TaxID=59490 RepID=A0AAW1VSI9_RUBAR
MSFLGEKGSASAQEANKAPGKKNIAWTSQIHAQFLEAIRCIGAENSTPKSILEFMNVEGLSTETVAVQLQKYLYFVRRVVAANNLSIGAKELIRSTLTLQPTIFQSILT